MSFNCIISYKKKDVNKHLLKYMISRDFWRNNSNNDMQCRCFNMTRVEDGKYCLNWSGLIRGAQCVDLHRPSARMQTSANPNRIMKMVMAGSLA